ncbi:MAG: hypothetical protein ACTSWQ_09930 [Candidatus Thorarchaeota archaeon]
MAKMVSGRECFIVGGGPSLKGFDFNLLVGKEVIVVNKAIIHVPGAKYFVTVDYTFLRKVNFSKLLTPSISKVFIACLHFDYIVEKGGMIVDTRSNTVYDLSDFDVVVKSRQAEGFGYRFFDFRNGYNSGYCALQLAVILGYKRINLLGFDLQVVKDQGPVFTHYHGGYGQNVNKFETCLEKYLRCFLTGLDQLNRETDVKVISLSPISKLNEVIPYKEVEEV